MPRRPRGAKGRREARLKKRGVTSSVKDFGWLCKNTSGRVGIVSEGDSWFAYPKLNILFGQNANIMDHVCAKRNRRVRPMCCDSRPTAMRPRP